MAISGQNLMRVARRCSGSSQVSRGADLTSRAVLIMRAVSTALVVAGLLVGLRALPSSAALMRPQASAGDGAAGTFATLAFGAAYVVAAPLLAPGPAPALQQEAYATSPDAAAYDHAVLDAVLKRHVSEEGSVDYGSLHRDSATLDGYVTGLATAPFDALGRHDRLALLINAYNAFTLRLVLDHWPVASIKDIPAAQRWDARRWRFAGRLLSLNQIEHEEIRPKFGESRIHFALVCAARGCPPLRREAYVGARLAEQLEDQARYIHAHERWFRWEEAARTAHLTELYRWYGGDFEKEAGSVPRFVARYSPPLQKALEVGRRPKTRWIPYDWSLNSKAPTP